VPGGEEFACSKLVRMQVSPWLDSHEMEWIFYHVHEWHVCSIWQKRAWAFRNGKFELVRSRAGDGIRTDANWKRRSVGRAPWIQGVPDEWRHRTPALWRRS